MLKKKPSKLDRTSLIRPVFRALLNRGRSYAAFDEDRVYPLVENLKDRKEILDPMSGYGSVMLYCAKLKIKSYNLEFSLPLYLWHVLVHPVNTNILLQSTDKLISLKSKWPKSSVRAAVSDDWFPEESKRLIVNLLDLIRSILEEFKVSKKKMEELTLALLIPFVGSLSSSVPGNVTTHVKQGGMCVYEDWHKDYTKYLSVVKARLSQNAVTFKSKTHTIRFGDCRTVKLPKTRFSAMVTSPPYPNRTDVSSMFAPENDCLSWLHKAGLISLCPLSESEGKYIIGTNVVSGITKNEVKSEVAKNFLRKIREFKDRKRPKAELDNERYYVPYFSHYFSDLEQAYENIFPSLKQNFEGYIIVVNNTARNQVVPVAKSVIETWGRLGFKAKIVDTLERFHIGTKNPRARGLKARHAEYTIKVWRR